VFGCNQRFEELPFNETQLLMFINSLLNDAEMDAQEKNNKK